MEKVNKTRKENGVKCLKISCIYLKDKQYMETNYLQ